MCPQDRSSRLAQFRPKLRFSLIHNNGVHQYSIVLLNIPASVRRLILSDFKVELTALMKGIGIYDPTPRALGCQTLPFKVCRIRYDNCYLLHSGPSSMASCCSPTILHLPSSHLFDVFAYRARRSGVVVFVRWSIKPVYLVGAVRKIRYPKGTDKP